MLSQLERDVDLLLTHNVMGHAEIIEIGVFEHQVIDALFHRSKTESDRMLPFVAMHEIGLGDHAVGQVEMVFNRPAQAEQFIELGRRLDIVLAQDAVPDPLRAGQELAEHRTARMKRLVRIDLGAEENLGRVAARIGQLEQPENPAFARLGFGAHGEGDFRRAQLFLHRGEFLRPGHAPAHVGQVIAAISVQDDAVMPKVHPQIEPVPFAFIDDFHAGDFGGVSAPDSEIGNGKTKIAEFGDDRHSSNSPNSPQSGDILRFAGRLASIRVASFSHFCAIIYQSVFHCAIRCTT